MKLVLLTLAIILITFIKKLKKLITSLIVLLKLIVIIINDYETDSIFRLFLMVYIVILIFKCL